MHELHEWRSPFVFRAYFLINYLLSLSFHSCRESAGGPADATNGTACQVDDLQDEFDKLQTHESAVGAQGLETSITFRYGQQQMPRWLVDGPDDTERQGQLASEVYLRLSAKAEARKKKSLRKSKAKVSGNADDDEAEDAEPALARALLDISLAEQTDVARRKAVTPTDGELIEFASLLGITIKKSHLDGALFGECASLSLAMQCNASLKCLDSACETSIVCPSGATPKSATWCRCETGW
jgi:hypothetical protein